MHVFFIELVLSNTTIVHRHNHEISSLLGLMTYTVLILRYITFPLTSEVEFTPHPKICSHLILSYLSPHCFTTSTEVAIAVAAASASDKPDPDGRPAIDARMGSGRGAGETAGDTPVPTSTGTPGETPIEDDNTE